ncbi:hypothetical protein WJX84_001707 [Apatococcus fuscideae]|uniref:Tudor domain-containing protein n=1 Tax=Apatococcus fuscideae TaxID=2026836 RepID=A0AAW1SXG3_9CHLO
MRQHILGSRKLCRLQSYLLQDGKILEDAVTIEFNQHLPETSAELEAEIELLTSWLQTTHHLLASKGISVAEADMDAQAAEADASLGTERSLGAIDAALRAQGFRFSALPAPGLLGSISHPPQQSPLALPRQRDANISSQPVLLGARVKIFWPDDAEWYPGTLTALNSITGRHHVQYDDGEQEDLCLEHEEWDLLDKSTKHTDHEDKQDSDAESSPELLNSRRGMPQRSTQQSVSPQRCISTAAQQ